MAVIDRADRIRFSREGFNAAETDFQENLVGIIENLKEAVQGHTPSSLG